MMQVIVVDITVVQGGDSDENGAALDLEGRFTFRNG